MQRDNIMSLQYKNNNFDFCIWKESRFCIGHYVNEDNLLSLTSSVIYKNKITKILLSTDVGVERYKTLKTLCELELVSSNMFKDQKYGCLNVLKDFLNIEGEFMETQSIKNNTDCLIQTGKCGSFLVFCFKQFNHLFLDNQTLHDLRVIQSKDTQTPLLKLLNFTKTTFGESTLRFLILHPLYDLNKILERQEMIAEIGNIIRTETLSNIKPFYKGNYIDPLKLKDFLIHSLVVVKNLENSKNSFEGKCEIYEQMISKIDIFEGEYLKRNISKAYDELRRIYEDLPGRLNKIATNLAYKNQVKLSVIYFPHIGYLIEVSRQDVDQYKLKSLIGENEPSSLSVYESEAYPVDSSSMALTVASERSNLFYQIQNEDSKSYTMKNVFDDILTRNSKRHKSSAFKDIPNSLYKTNKENQNMCDASGYSFALKESIFIKNKLMNKLDEELGDVYNLMEELKNRQIHETIESIDRTMLDILIEYIGRVDALHSLFLFKKKYNCTKPDIFYNKDGYEACNWRIKITNYFYNRLDIDITKNLIYKGSQDILRIIGQISIIVQIGSFVPSDFVAIPLFDKIFTSLDVSEVPESSYFLSSIRRISTILKFTGAHSLVLLDSFGYGTNTEEGLKIFLSVHRNLKFPVVLSMTQFTEIFNKISFPKFMIRFAIVRNGTKYLSEGSHSEFETLKSSLIDIGFEKEFVEEVENEANNLLVQNKL
ncbi:DNA mismatch repair protein MutS [Nosema granulosis]|uniref:DNA mismatch repair protein MutS n=1 Tax=Nosema granulosis TaxID=83296 RepID=A0A9P6H0M6_9MICR|nr:DNA mismatch repair protein MutS [Nosema granulosis]